MTPFKDVKTCMSVNQVRAGSAGKAARSLAAVACLLSLLAATDARAGDPVSDGWTFQLAPYVWALGIEGDVTVKGQKADVDVGFGDIFDSLDLGGMLEAEVRKGRLGVFGNVAFMDLGLDSNVGPFDIDTDIFMMVAGFGGYYRLGPFDLDSSAGSDGPRLIVDPYVGARYTYLDLELDLDPGPTRAKDKDWIDPIVGVRTIWQLSPSWSISIFGDVGGFGVGSDFQWLANGTVGYSFGIFGERDSKVLLGYRALGQDYDSGSGANKFEWDVTLHGPVIAFAIEF